MTAFLLVVLRVVGRRTGPGPEELPEALELLAVHQAAETRCEGPRFPELLPLSVVP